MGLADRLENTPSRSTGMPCSVGALEERLEGKEAEAFYAMLHTLGWSASRVYEAVTAEGYEIGRQTINRHRSRSCKCFKAAS